MLNRPLAYILVYWMELKTSLLVEINGTEVKHWYEDYHTKSYPERTTLIHFW